MGHKPDPLVQDRFDIHDSAFRFSENNARRLPVRRSHRSFTSSGSTSAVGDWPGSTSSHSTRHFELMYSRKTASCH